MWTRRQLKERAKKVLRNNYWQAFLVSLVILISTTAGKWGNIERRIDRIIENHPVVHDFVPSEIIYWTSGLMFFLASITVILLILRIVIGYNLEVSGRKFFIKAAQGESNMSYLGYCFKERRYLGVIMTMLLKAVFNFLWYLLLVIPGIIKTYAYSMVPYILADNPFIGAERAIELSNEMTRGEKWDMFVLDLSFLGWYILGVMACGIGTIFVYPYANATKAELYLNFREELIEEGITSYEELNLEYDKTEI
ncbi:DUF975 family protein [Clostridium oceanicum]|uniref:DUF975 family protein n=1 Tax=Clostridium oceanicum TaxID=1543 RepID=A0ABP3UP96_9CLOT